MMSVTLAGVKHGSIYDRTKADSQSVSELLETYGFVEWHVDQDEGDPSMDLPTSDSFTVPTRDATTDSIDSSLLDYKLLLLQMAADNGDETTFIRIYQEIEWEQRSAEDILMTIDLALTVGAYLAARKLAMEGIQKFPNHAELKKMSTLLAPPEVTVSNRKPDPGIRVNRDWLKNNRAKYIGSWVALKNGELLNSANSVDELIAEIGEIKNKNILVTKVY
jgi:hypothetical protein